ncbi:prepilin-type N-terminal cleavage/methylation domain-containing protein [Acinetobacter sp. B10A]|uniref:type IV pilin protein n=1 Tax=Acinetobacter baretiae TaxID=2605383 RepID=UPI001B3CA24D|nr:type IV pilin protein [Acinetobacter baretiae]MBF7686175.1 prepilin-type N-terminal cleavage/methylation domain-containing protein [Acinetobacter baretiae]
MVNVKYKGFTLVEIMIVVAIIALLAAIAYPSYTRHVVNSNRADVQAELTRLSGRLQSYITVNRTYRDATLANIGGTANYPSQGVAKYTLNLVVDADTRGYTLSAVPLNGTQKNNGVVCLNQEGQKNWNQTATKENECLTGLNSTSTWNK